MASVLVSEMIELAPSVQPPAEEGDRVGALKDGSVGAGGLNGLMQVAALTSETDASYHAYSDCELSASSSSETGSSSCSAENGTDMAELAGLEDCVGPIRPHAGAVMDVSSPRTACCSGLHRPCGWGSAHARSCSE